MSDYLHQSPNNNPSGQFAAEHSPEDEEYYYFIQTEHIKSGVKTWIVRNFDVEKGRVYSLFLLGKEIAMVDDEGDGHYRVYARDTDGEQIAVYDATELIEAINLAEDYYDIRDL